MKIICEDNRAPKRVYPFVDAKTGETFQDKKFIPSTARSASVISVSMARRSAIFRRAASATSFVHPSLHLHSALRTTWDGEFPSQ